MATAQEELVRPAFRNALPEDEPFLQKLFSETNEGLRWMLPQTRPMLAEMQYRARALSYAAAYAQLEDRILCLEDGTAVGRHLVQRGEVELRTVDIAVLPQYQRQGIGTASLKQISEECASKKQAHLLSVAKGNPALELYRRLGFIVTGDDEVYLQMRWSAE